jgi:hypothetical protein
MAGLPFGEGDKIRLSYTGFAYRANKYGDWDILDDAGNRVLTFEPDPLDVIEVLERKPA